MTLLMCAVDCGWNVTKALSTCHPAVAVAVPTATQHCVTSSVSSVSQHCAVTQASAAERSQQIGVNDGKDAGVMQPVTEKLTEQGRLVCLIGRLTICNFLLSLPHAD